jgi:thiamine-monophosphate kinase
MRLESALFDVAITGGDDYEILCTTPPLKAAAFEAAARAAGVAVARIGQVNEYAHLGAVFLDAAGAQRKYARGSYSHF